MARQFTFEELDRIMDRARADEFTMFISFYGGKVNVSLEKESSYGGKMHMKFQADGKTVSEAFEKCILNFPANPVGAVWDTKRLVSPIEDGEFTEVPPPAPITADDDIPF